MVRVDCSQLSNRLWMLGERDVTVYKELASTWKRFNEFVEFVLDRCQGNETIVDVGTGSGLIPVLLAVNQPGLKITAVDISPVDKLARYKKYFNINVQQVQGDIYKPNLKADIVLCTEVLEHLEDDKLAFESLKQIAPKMFLSFPSEDLGIIPGHLRYYTKETIEKLTGAKEIIKGEDYSKYFYYVSL